ncbi:MAG: hypothetical protein LUE86_11495 [Clostridiales bacterium]|nr:hypothetical protein [Clostridiales bacterium]
MMSEAQMKGRYREAVQLYTRNTRGSVLNGSPTIQWEADRLHFTYERQVREQEDVRTVTVRVDALSGETEELPSGRSGGSSSSNVPKDWSLSPGGGHALYTRAHNLILREMSSGEEKTLTDE